MVTRVAKRKWKAHRKRAVAAPNPVGADDVGGAASGAVDVPAPPPEVIDGAVPPPPVPDEDTADAVAERKKIRDLKAEAKTTRHQMNHKPANPYCDACNMTKLPEKQHFKGSFTREVKKVGDIITADHLTGKKSAKKKDWVGCTGAKNAINIKDLYTKLKGCYSVKDKGHREVVR